MILRYNSVLEWTRATHGLFKSPSYLGRILDSVWNNIEPLEANSPRSRGRSSVKQVSESPDPRYHRVLQTHRFGSMAPSMRRLLVDYP